MIPAEVWPRFARWFTGHVESRLRRQFARVRIRGLHRARSAAEAAPLLFASNHTAWWDGMLALWLARRTLGLDTYYLMDADNLIERPFFARLGGFGVRRGSRTDGAEAIAYAAAQLAHPGCAAWIFPEGEERAFHGPLRFRPGASAIARRAPEAAIVPVALGYSFGATERPDAWISIGEPPRSAAPRAVREAVQRERDAILGGIAGDAGFEDHLVVGTNSWASIPERVLSRLTAGVTHAPRSLGG